MEIIYIMPIYLGIDLGTTQIKVGVVDDAGRFNQFLLISTMLNKIAIQYQQYQIILIKYKLIICCCYLISSNFSVLCEKESPHNALIVNESHPNWHEQCPVKFLCALNKLLTELELQNVAAIGM